MFSGGENVKIAIIDTCTITKGDVSLDEIAALGEVSYFDEVEYPDIPDEVKAADAIICNKADINREFIESCENLKYIGLFATGYNNIDIETAKKRGIAVANVPGYSTHAVAQLTMSMILALACSLVDYANSTREGGWIKSPTFSYFPYPMFELRGKTLGVFGYGDIGREVAHLGNAFGMEVIVSTRTPSKCTEFPIVSRDELFARSDFLTLHAPLNDDTRLMVNERTLSIMKKSAYLVNTSRGGEVDEAALARALNEGRIAGAGIDVLTAEPMRADNPLLTAKNCIITPHVAWAPIETRRRLITLVAENLERFMNGEPQNIVNK